MEAKINLKLNWFQHTERCKTFQHIPFIETDEKCCIYHAKLSDKGMELSHSSCDIHICVHFVRTGRVCRKTLLR